MKGTQRNVCNDSASSDTVPTPFPAPACLSSKELITEQCFSPAQTVISALHKDSSKQKEKKKKKTILKASFWYLNKKDQLYHGSRDTTHVHRLNALPHLSTFREIIWARLKILLTAKN